MGWLKTSLQVAFILFVIGSSFAGMSSLAEGKDYLTYCKDANTPADIRYTIDALQEFIGSSDCDRSFELLNRRSIITLKNKQLRTVEPLGSFEYTQKLELIEGDHKLPPCSPTSVQPPKGLETLGTMAGLIEIRFENYNLRSAEFLRSFNGLLKVDLTCNKIKDISPAAQMSGLQQLVVPYNEIESLPSFTGLTDLEWAKFSHNKISKVQSFRGMTRLGRLNLSHNKLTEFPDTDFMSYLDLAHNQIRGGSHPGAGYLRLGHNKLSDLSFVQNPAKVSDLAINDNQLRSVRGLSSFSSLYSLDISRNPIKDFSASAVPSGGLDGLSINGIPLTQMPRFASFNRLHKLSMAKTGLKSFDQQQLPPNLHSLNISGNALTELTLTNRAILGLNASNNQLSTVRFACPGTELETLINIDFNPLRSAPQLSGCPLLSGFSARKTGLKDVQFLAAVVDLWRVDLGQNPISNLMPLKDLDRIAVIELDGILLDKPGAKTAANCPADAASKALADWCSSEL